MTFVGTEFVKKDDHTGTITGKLTLHGVTKPVTLNVVVNKVGQSPLDKIDSFSRIQPQNRNVSKSGDRGAGLSLLLIHRLDDELQAAATRARNELGDENRDGELMKEFPLARRKTT